MRRVVYILILVVSLALAGCDLFGPDKKGGTDEEGGDGGDGTLVISES